MRYVSIGKQLRRARKRLGRSQFEVAETMGCSRAQVDNIEVARQRAPLHRLEDFAKAVGHKLIVQVVPADASVVSVRVPAEWAPELARLSEMDSVDRELAIELLRLIPRLPHDVRNTLHGIVAIWKERFASDEVVHSAQS